MLTILDSPMSMTRRNSNRPETSQGINYLWVALIARIVESLMTEVTIDNKSATKHHNHATNTMWGHLPDLMPLDSPSMHLFLLHLPQPLQHRSHLLA